jgi:hypothetical protein
MSSSELNDFELNLDRLARLAQMVLNQRALDSTVVGGKSAYTANDLVYDSAVSTYDGTFTQLARSSASLNGLSASIASTPVVVVSASGALGGLTSSSISVVSHTASSTASLGSINSTATTIPQILPVLDAPLGDLANSASSTVTHIATAASELGAMTATANSLPTIKPVFMGSLGTLDATATATVIPPTPPEPVAPGYGSNRPYPAPPLRQPKVEPVPQPPTPVIVDTPPARPVRMPATITATTSALSPAFSISVQAQVEWSILEDEAELLLLL